MSVVVDDTILSAQLATLSSAVAHSQEVTHVKRGNACETCYKRKIKCDTAKPICSSCSRSGHPCHYVNVRCKKSVRKRTDIRLLEGRLKELEALLMGRTDNESSAGQQTRPPSSQLHAAPTMAVSVESPVVPVAAVRDLTMDDDFEFAKDTTVIETTALEDFECSKDTTVVETTALGDFDWDLISPGLEEPLPSPDITNNLYTVFFKHVHPTVPFIHRSRFMASLNMSENRRPPLCLSYIMWALACILLPHYKPSAEEFYKKARMYIERDEMTGCGESFLSIAHTQCWLLICRYEYEAMYLHRAFISAGRASRLALIQGLHRLDAESFELGIKQISSPVKDWIEQEERRRTFWMVYCQDRYVSLGGGWPLCIDERDVMTNLPASDEAYHNGTAESTSTLENALLGTDESISVFAERCVLATLIGRNRAHLQQSTLDNCDHDLNGEFWTRHQLLDSIILSRASSLPDRSGLTSGLSNPIIILVNIQIYAVTICLHQGAILKADKYGLYSVSAESQRRCIAAAHQITTILRMCSYQDLCQLSPVVGFCLFVAARVLVQNLDSEEDSTGLHSSLNILCTTMSTLRLQNPLTEFFLCQFDLELSALGSKFSSIPNSRRYSDAGRDRVPAE